MDGEVVGASRRILTDLLRGELGFDGLVILDYHAINMIHDYHHVAPDKPTAARLGADGLDGVDGGEHHLRIVHVRGAHQDRKRDALGIDHKMALRALFAAIRGVLARFLAPGAGTAAEYSTAQSGN